MKRKIILVLLCGFALWCDLSEGSQCPYNFQSLLIPNYTNSYYNSNASLSCIDIAHFPLSSCLTDSVYRSSSALAGDPVGRRVFQAAFNSNDWTGQLLAYQADSTTGILSPIASWNPGNALAVANSKNTLNPYSFNHPDFTYLKQSCKPQCPSSLLAGIPLTYQNLSASQENLIDPKNIYSNYITDYLSGNTQCEEPNTCTYIINISFSFRQRPVLLGDLINSDPLFVGSEDFNYSSLPESKLSSYPTFVLNKSQVDGTTYPRPRMVYVGGNDGRMHGFEAGTWNRNIQNAFDTGVGTEVFSFFPGSIFNYDIYARAYVSPTTQIPLLTPQNPLYHRYLVDGSPKAGDAYFSGAWHTVLLGTTGASNSGASTQTGRILDNGGSIFALDITNPINPSFASGNVLWEFTNNPDLINSGQYAKKFPLSHNWADPDLGVALSQPSLVRMQNGKWAAIVGNGYNSPNQIPVLYILDISLTPASPNFIIAKFSPCFSNTSIGTNSPTNFNSNCTSGIPNGLSTPIAVDVNNDQRVDYIYAGDLQGNLWKFDVNCSDYSNGNDDSNCQKNSSVNSSDYWQVANGGKPLFVTCDNNTPCVRQPITAKPQVGSVSSTQANTLYAANEATSPSSPNKPSVMVYFGTGSYLGLCDVESSITLGVTCPQQQNFTQQQTVYALWDRNQGTASTDNSIAGRSSLLQQTILTPSSITQNNTTTAVANVRVTSTASSNLPCYQTSCAGQTTNTTQSQQSGWYMDLSTPSNMPSERSVSFPNLLNGNIVFSTQLPTSTPCDPNTQASGWVMELDAITGNAPSNPVFLNIFGTNPLGKAPNYDLVTAKIGNATTTMAPSGIQSTVGILKTPALIYGQGVVHKYFGGSTGPTGPTTGIQMVTDPGSTQGRVSWLQLR